MSLDDTQNVQPPSPRLMEHVGEFTAHFYESFCEKLSRQRVPVSLLTRRLLLEERIPDICEGTIRYRAYVAEWGRGISQEHLEQWCREWGRVLPSAKAGIDMALAFFSSPQLDMQMPLSIAGQSFDVRPGKKAILCFKRGIVWGRVLSYEHLETEWSWLMRHVILQRL